MFGFLGSPVQFCTWQNISHCFSSGNQGNATSCLDINIKKKNLTKIMNVLAFWVIYEAKKLSCFKISVDKERITMKYLFSKILFDILGKMVALESLQVSEESLDVFFQRINDTDAFAVTNKILLERKSSYNFFVEVNLCNMELWRKHTERKQGKLKINVKSYFVVDDPVYLEGTGRNIHFRDFLSTRNPSWSENVEEKMAGWVYIFERDSTRKGHKFRRQNQI